EGGGKAGFAGLPDVPTVSAVVRGFEASAWQGVGVPRGTPNEIIERLNREINDGLANPVIKARLADAATTPMVFTPAEFGAYMAAETEKWAKVIRAANIKVEGLREAGRREMQGGRYETSPPQAISAAGRRPCCASGRLADRLGANLPVAAGAHLRRFSRRRRRRHRRSPDRPMALGAARPAILHREPAGRRQ